MLAAGPHRRQELGRARGDEDEDGGARRLLQGLQEGVLAMLVERLGAVDQRHLAPRHERPEPQPPRQLPRLLGADVAPVGIAHDHQHVGVRAGRDPYALVAGAARAVRPGIRAQKLHRERVGDAALADARRPGQEVRGCRAVGRGGASQARDRSLVADHVDEPHEGPVSAARTVCTAASTSRATWSAGRLLSITR